MPYIDPIELLQIQVVPGQPIQAEELRRAKRKLMAEFELQGGATISFKGQEVDKQTVLAAVDQLEDPVQQDRLVRIHTHVGLKKVLHEQDLRSLLALPPAEKLGPPEFRKYLSAQLAPVFNEMLLKQVKASDWSMAARMLNRLDLIDPWDHDMSTKGLVSHLRLNLIRLKEIPASSELADWDEPNLYTEGLLTTANRLPQSFQSLRNQYAEALQDIALPLAERHHKNKVAYRIITAAASLSVDVNISNRIQHNQLWIWNRVKRDQADELRDQAKQADHSSFGGSKGRSSSSETKRSAWAWVIILILIGVGIRFAVMSPRRSTEYDFLKNYKPPTITVPEFKTSSELFNDSTLEAIVPETTVSIPAPKSAFDRQATVRYDTFFFKDLIFYEKLNARPATQGQTIDPETGSELYSSILHPKTGIYAEDKEKSPVVLKNNSSHSLVLFFETLSGGTIIRTFFLPPQSQFRTEELPKTFFKVRAYAGKEMLKDAFEYKGKLYPAFSKVEHAVNTTVGESNERDGNYMLFNFGLKDFQTQEITPIVLQYSAGGVLSTKD